MQSPDPEDLDQEIERFTSRLRFEVPDDDFIILRSDRAAIANEIAVAHAQMIEDLAEQDDLIARLTDEISRLETEIAGLKARSAELHAESQARIKEINANIARLEELLIVARKNLSILEAIAER